MATCPLSLVILVSQSRKSYPIADHSLHCGLNAPPRASQAFVPGVVSGCKTCFND